MSVQELTDRLMLTQIEKLIEAAVLAEREAIAKIVEEWDVYKTSEFDGLAATIRARSPDVTPG